MTGADPGYTGATGPAGTSASNASGASVGDLVGEITRDFSTLMRQEVALAKAEITDSAKKAGKGGGMLGGAAMAGHFVLLFLSIALWWALGEWFDSLALSALVVAVVWGVVAAVLALKGRDEMRKVQGVPQTTETLSKIPNAVKGHEEENR